MNKLKLPGAIKRDEEAKKKLNDILEGKKPRKRRKKKKVIKTVKLNDFIIKDIKTLDESLINETEPFKVQDFNQFAKNHNLTEQYIKEVLQVDYMDQEENWLDLSIVHYNEGRIIDDYLGLLYKKESLIKEQEINNEYQGSLRFLIKDPFLVLISSNAQKLEEVAEKMEEHYKYEYGMKEVKASYKLI